MNRILPLAQEVIDRIAAGEVIQRPCSAVKELIENSVDAGASSILVTMKNTMIQVQDNGSGIHPDDLSLICKRFNTSKLREFDDLKQMTTYGFRGEALSSITHVARVTITTQQANQTYSYRASYKDGAIVGKPTKCAGVPGTTITIEDLFYNVPQRLRALKSWGEEYNKILEVVQKYSVLHSDKVAFTCKRAGVHSPDVHTIVNNGKRGETIGKIYGTEISRELIEFSFDQSELFSMIGMVTNANYSRKKNEFLLFINNRLVDSNALKRVVETCYSECLPKGTHPFVFLSLKIPLENIDVNVHPTKKEVQFLNEEEICSSLNTQLKQVLLEGNESRTFETSKILPTTSSQIIVDSFDKKNKRVSLVENFDQGEDEEEEEILDNKRQRMEKKKPVLRPDKLVRTDSEVGNGLDRFLVKKENSIDLEHVINEDLTKEDLIIENSDALELQSIKTLLEQVSKDKSKILTDSLKRSVFVGVVDGTFSLIQYDTSLVSINHLKIAHDIFYQQVLTLFGRFKPIFMEPSVEFSLFLSNEEYQDLMDRKDLLHEYFGIDIRSGKLESLPRLLPNHFPQSHCILNLIRNLSKNVNWNIELDCFQEIAKHLANAYSEMPPFRPLITTAPGTTTDQQEISHAADKESIQYVVKNVIFPAFRNNFQASIELFDSSNGWIVPLAKLEKLYQIFERC